MAQPPFGPPPPAKKSSSGCWIALAVVGGILLLIGGAVALAVYKLATSKEGQAIISVVGDGAAIMRDAQNAPGTPELERLGCKQALVIDVDRIKRLVEKLDGGTPTGGDDTSRIVMCEVGTFGSPPACDDVARTYVSAAGRPPRGFAVSVQQKNKNAVCSGTYLPDGTRQGDFDASQAPALPVAE